jgi:hypothetical protein
VGELYPIKSEGKFTQPAKNAQLNAQYIDDKMLSKKGGIEMPISEKKKASNNRYTQKCDTINIRPLKERGTKIR